MKKIFLIITTLFLAGIAFSQTQPIEIPANGYRFQHRIKGPSYKNSEILELRVDEYGNYLVATYRGEKASFVYLYVYNLYTWEEKYKVKLNDNRCELYNSVFDESGRYFYVNYDIYRNKFKKLDFKTGEIEEVECTETPKGCQKIEPQIYKVEAYTIGDNYYIYRDPKFINYIKILVKKEMYIPKVDEEGYGSGLNPANGGVIQLSPQMIRELRAGQELVYQGIHIIYDPNGIDALGNVIPYVQEEGNYKIRLTENETSKLDKKISFMYDKFVVKLDLEALEKEQQQ